MDFNYENTTITSSGAFIPSKKNAPLDARGMVDKFEDIKDIPNPYVGMEITVKNDETKKGKRTKYVVNDLKPNALGVENSIINVDTLTTITEFLGIEDFVSEDNNIILNGTEEDNSMKNLVLQNAEGRRFKLIIEADGSLGAKEVPAPLKAGYEVKFLVDQEVVLDEDGNYIEEFQNLFTDFELKGATNMSYYDTEELALNKEGWTIRIRKKSNKKAQQCTFKKRYSGINQKEVLVQKEVDKALKNAVKDGYNTLNIDFPEAEIDYSFSNATLSFSCDIDIAETGKDNTDIPNSEESIAFIEANKPEIFDLPLEGIREHGAVILTSYSAMMEDVEVAIESMTIKASKDAVDETETIIEVSFKLEDYEGERADKTDLEIVNELREKLRTKLNEGGYLIERNGLKTNSVLERY